jgi:hypothetical protein
MSPKRDLQMYSIPDLQVDSALGPNGPIPKEK